MAAPERSHEYKQFGLSGERMRFGRKKEAEKKEEKNNEEAQDNSLKKEEN